MSKVSNVWEVGQMGSLRQIGQRIGRLGVIGQWVEDSKVEGDRAVSRG